MSTIAVIEDEEAIVELISFNLKRQGYQVFSARSGEEGLELIRNKKPDLILLDLMLPQLSGHELCRIVKSQKETQSIPIIMVTAKGQEEDIVRGLEGGADDYVAKPFSPKVLLARIQAVLRRKHIENSLNGSEILIKDLHIHPGKFEARLGDRKLDLTRTEFGILQLLAKRPGWVFTRSQIVGAVQGDNVAVTDRSVDVQIVGLRKKLSGDYIETIRGIGYRFRE